MKVKAASSFPSAVPTLEAIAQAAAVSVPTASLALNDHERVSRSTKQRVLEVAARLGYVPNQAARRLARARFTRRSPFDHVGFVLFDRMGPELDGPYLEMMRGVEHQVAAFHAAMMFLRVSGGADRGKVERLLRSGLVDGWLMAGHVDDEALRLVAGSGAPCVVLGGHSCRMPVFSVDVDFKAAGRMAAEQMAAHGHRRIGFVGATMRFAYQRDLLSGFRAAVSDLGLEADPDLIQIHEKKSGHSLGERLSRLLAIRMAPTAIFAAESRQSIRALEWLRQHGIEVPGQVSLVGCEIESKRTPATGIARVGQPLTAIGRAGASLLKELAGQPGSEVRQIVIPPVWVSGGSLAPGGARPPS